jgi:multidrug efflux pump subunit AcrB
MAEHAPQGGVISWMARNSVAANLLMFLIIIAGLVGSQRIIQEIFPGFEIDFVRVTVPYPGASPEEVEQGVVLAIEEAVRGVEGVKRVISVASENGGGVYIELLITADSAKALSDVKTAVDRIQSFPEEIERPNVSMFTNPMDVISVVISGNHDRSVLHQLAEELRRRLIADPDITQVELRGVPEREFSIEVPRENLEALGLTLDEVAAMVTRGSLELPGGAVDTPSGEVLLRVADRKTSAAAMGNIAIKTSPSGSVVHLDDIATLDDGYADDNFQAFFNNRPAVMLTAFRVGSESPISVAAALKRITNEFQAELPRNVELAVWNDGAELLEGRIELLLRNGRLGLFLVLIILASFLNLRLSFWVALGIPISFCGAFLLMPVFDVSINMISLFGLIVTLGMVVDDAIVIGEAAYTRMEDGEEPLNAAINGAREMAMPVTFAILTTIAAFSPMLFVPGFSGKLFRILPVVIISVLIFSLIESFFVLPAHLGHTRYENNPSRLSRVIGLVELVTEPVRLRVTGALKRFIEHVYKPAIETTLNWRYLASACALFTLLISFGAMAGGWIPMSFLPNIEGEIIFASARLPYGAPLEQTQKVGKQLEASLDRAIARLGPETIRGRYTTVGQGPMKGGPGGTKAEQGSHLLAIQVYLVGTDKRDYSSADFASVWSEETPPIVGLESLNFESAFGPSAGAAVDLQMTHASNEVLVAAADEVMDILRGYSDLTQIESSYAAGKTRLDYHLLPQGQSLGLTSFDLGRQLRSAFYGAEALREQRGRDETKVMVRLPKDQRTSEFDLSRFRVRTPTGGMVPLGDVAELERNRAPTEIQREDGRRRINVKAALVSTASSAQEVTKALNTTDIPALKAKYPGLEIEYAGEQREQQESLSALFQNYLVALLVMYGLLAIPFRSYIQPLIIMSAIPFGIVGALLGHLLMGYTISIISMFGIVALSGVVVNDSLVLIDTANRYRASGMNPSEAIKAAGVRRLRPILLTSLTTFFGLAPMIFETSMQARFLVPMAISLGFGVLFATVIVLGLIPAFYLIVEDIRNLFGFGDEHEEALATTQRELIPTK